MARGERRCAQGCAFADDLAEFVSNMKIDTLHIGMKVRHPQYGVGVVKSLTEQTAEIAFDDAQRTIAPASSDLQPAEATATLSELEMPLANLIRDTARAVTDRSPRSTSCSKTRTTSSEPGPRPAQWADRMPE